MGNAGEVGESLLQPKTEGTHRHLAAASDEPVNMISQSAASIVTRVSAQSRESAKTIGAHERDTAHFNDFVETRQLCNTACARQ